MERYRAADTICGEMTNEKEYATLKFRKMKFRLIWTILDQFEHVKTNLIK